MKQRNYVQARLAKKRKFARRKNIVMGTYYAVCTALFIIIWSTINGALDPTISDSRFFGIFGLLASVFSFMSFMGWTEISRLLGLEE